MTVELLENIRLYMKEKVRADHVSANNCRANGYIQLALDLENQEAFGNQILRDLASEGDKHADHS